MHNTWYKFQHEKKSVGLIGFLLPFQFSCVFQGYSEGKIFVLKYNYTKIESDKSISKFLDGHKIFQTYSATAPRDQRLAIRADSTQHLAAAVALGDRVCPVRVVAAYPEAVVCVAECQVAVVRGQDQGLVLLHG